MLLLDTFASLAQPPKTAPELGRIEQLRAMAVVLPTSLGRLSCPPSVRSACSSSRSPVGRQVCRSSLNERKADTDESTMNLRRNYTLKPYSPNCLERLSENSLIGSRLSSHEWSKMARSVISPS